MASLDTAAHTTARAWTERGRAPAYHRTQVERLRRDWPTLANALDELAVVVGKAKSKEVSWEQLELPDEYRWKLVE